VGYGLVDDDLEVQPVHEYVVVRKQLDKLTIATRRIYLWAEKENVCIRTRVEYRAFL